MNMTVRRMVTIIEEKFGADSKNAMYMRVLAKGYYLKHGVTFEECRNFYQLLLKKQLTQSNKSDILTKLSLMSVQHKQLEKVEMIFDK